MIHARRLLPVTLFGAVLSVMPVLASRAATPGRPLAGQTCLFIEAERFDDYGGWVADPQFMDQMGSTYLLAHGLGKPVRDAVTTVAFPAAGRYRLWVRTRNWVAPWQAPGAPGRFQLLINGKPLATTFGTEGAKWHWQDGGQVNIAAAGKVKIALHDLTGFEGRCDAILFTTDAQFSPPNTMAPLAEFRRAMLGLPDRPRDGGQYDLVVVGGGMAGTCAALAAARLGLKVVLIQDRPVLGGNSSSEVRVWLNGARNREPWPRVGDIVAELDYPPGHRPNGSPDPNEKVYLDNQRLAIARAQKNLTLRLDHRANVVEKTDGRITAVCATHTRTGRRYRFTGRWFADCTGDGCIGYLAGADWDMTRTGHMGRTNLWYVVDTGKPAPFPRCPWALDLSDKPFPGRGEKTDKRIVGKLGKWYWESGFDHDPLEKSESIRDWNFRAAYGAWDALKNVDKVLPNYRLGWMAYITGKRESRRLLGDVVLSKDDLLSGRSFDDACVPLGWSMDLHLPDPRYVKGFQGDAFISRASFGRYKMPYFIPYRCLYSRNVANLFMAGRDISVTHEALGAVRVMRTGGCMGEIVGMAAAVCKKRDADPRDVYAQYLDDLKALMRRGVGREKATTTDRGFGGRPSKPANDRAKPVSAVSPPTWLKKAGPNLAATAHLTVSSHYDAARYPSSNLADGKADLRNNAGRWVSERTMPAWVEFRWDRPQTISAVRVRSGYCHGGRTGDPIRSFTLQTCTDGQWRDVAGAGATDNTAVDWSGRFTAVTTNRLRLLVSDSPNDTARIWEIGLYHPGP